MRSSYLCSLLFQNHHMNPTNSTFLLTFAFIAFGYALKKGGLITEQDGKTLSKFMMQTSFPALVLLLFMQVHFEPHLFTRTGLAIGLGSTMLTIAWFAFKTYPNALRGILTMGAGGLNTVMFGFPIVEGIWGRDALTYAVLFDLGNTIVVFALVYPIGSYFALSGQTHVMTVLKKVMQLRPLQAMLIGLIINALSIPIPKICIDFLDVLGKANKPVVLILMGIYLNFVFEKQQLKAVSKVLMIRYATGLTVAFLLYNFMLPSVERSVLIVCVLLPVGLTIMPFSDEFQYDSRIAGLLVNASMIISFLVTWALVLGLKL